MASAAVWSWSEARRTRCAPDTMSHRRHVQRLRQARHTDGVCPWPPKAGRPAALHVEVGQTRNLLFVHLQAMYPVGEGSGR
eukprot:163068-Chlamydomonas_euryale.AAC.1